MYKVKLDEEKRGRSDKTAKRRESSATQQGVRTNQTAAKVLTIYESKRDNCVQTASGRF